MSANKHTNKLKLQNYAYEVSDNGVFIHPKETSNVWFQPFTYDNIAHAYYPIPGHGDYPFIEASDIDWRPYKIDGHDVVTSYDIIHSMEVMSSSYWVAGEGTGSIIRVIDQHMGTAAGAYAISEGVQTEASGEAAHAEGDSTVAQGKNSHAEGQQSGALKVNSHAEGYRATGDNSGAHAEGNRTTASGLQAHAEGNATEASGNNSHSEGNNTTSSGLNSHAEGSNTIASGLNSHAQGNNTIASGENSHAEGVGADERGAIGKQSHAEGLRALASGTNSHAEGSISTASGTASHAEGNLTEASGVNSHAEGNGTKSLGSASHAEGVNTYAAGKTSHAEGKQNQAWGENSHAEGFRTYTSGMASHSEGAGTITALTFINQEANATIYETNGDVELHENDIIKYGSNFARVVSIDGNDITLSNTLGEITTDIPYAIGKVAYGDYSHAEGFDTKAIGTYSHAEGNGTIAYGEASHAEGSLNMAVGSYSHAEGMSTYVSGDYAHGEGKNTFASGDYSHAEGLGFAELTDYKLTSSSSSQYIVSDIVNDVPKQNDLLMYNGIIGRVIFFNSTSNILRVMPSFGTISSPTQVYKISGVAFDTTSHVEGSQNIAIGAASHAEGVKTMSVGAGTHTEGFGTVVRCNYGHAEGIDTVASGTASHAEGEGSMASGQNSHTEGNHTHATNLYEHAQGTYNLSTKTDTSSTFGSNGNTLHSIGIGTSDDDRKNAVEVMQNGDMYVIGIGDYDGTNFTTASTLQQSLTDSTAYAATKVDQIIATGNASYRLLFKYSPNDNQENSYTYFADSIWYNPSLDALTNKGGAYFATTSGTVGIGTATPQKKLDVQGDSMFNGIVNIDSNTMGVKTHINFNRASFNYVNVPTGGTFAVSVNGASGTKTRLAVDNIAAFPGETNDSIDLGKPNYHWRAAYVNRIRTQSYELMETNNGTRIGFGTFNHNKAAYVNVGNLLVSNLWSDASKVPYDGIYSKGPIHVGHNNDVALGSAKTGDIVIGDFAGTNIAVDNNEIMARNNGAASTLNLNLDGGQIAVGGPITRFYKNASDEPMIALTSNDKDTWLWRINWDTTASSLATSAKYGFGLKYIGTGSGNDNSLVLYADNQAGTQVKAVEVKQNGATYTYQNIYALSYVTLGNSTTADRTTVTSVLNVDGNTTIAGYLKANAYVTLGNSTTADRTTVTSVLNVDGNTTIKDGSYLKALGNVTLGNSTTADTTTVASILNIDGNTTIKDGSYLKALGNVTLGNSTTADTTLVNSVLNAQADITAVGYIRTNSKNAYIGTPGEQCHLQYDNNAKCIKFIFD